MKWAVAIARVQNWMRDDIKIEMEIIITEQASEEEAKAEASKVMQDRWAWHDVIVAKEIE